MAPHTKRSAYSAMKKHAGILLPALIFTVAAAAPCIRALAGAKQCSPMFDKAFCSHNSKAPKQDQEFSAVDGILAQLNKIGQDTKSATATEDFKRFFLPTDDTKVLNLENCMAIAIQNNPALQQKLSVINSIAGDELIDKSRFFSHVDMLANFTKANGNILKTYYPTYNPMPVSPVGTAALGGGSSLSSLSSGGGGGTGGINADTIQSLTGMNVSDLSGLAAQYGVDLSQFGFKPANTVTATPAPAISATPTPAESAAQTRSAELAAEAQRQADITIPPVPINTPPPNSTPIGSVGPITIPDDQLLALLGGSGGTNNTVPGQYVDNKVSIRYSRRLLEWGKDPVSQVGIRANRRISIFNYQQELRTLLTNVRTTFFLILLKQKQIEDRKGLLAAYVKTHQDKQTRYEIAKDVPMIDVLTAELDVLNEEGRINNLQNDLLNKKMELLKLMGRPVGSDFVLVGQPPNLESFEFGLDAIVKLTKDNSYQVTYLREEIGESNRELGDLKRDYKPKYTAKAGFENHTSNMGFTLNNSDNTYGLDFGAEQHLNLPNESNNTNSVTSLLTGSHTKDNNYFMNLGVAWNIDDNMKREGLTLKQLENLNKMKSQLTDQELSEELSAREAYQALLEAVNQLQIQQRTLEISDRRLEITRKLREFGKVTDYQVDNYRLQFFNDQDRLFSAQESVISAQENLRKIMGVFF